MEQPWWDALRTDGGPLVPAAEAFVARRGLGPFPRGSEGVCALVAEIDAFAHDLDADDDDDRRFVEGAGALFGLLLLDHQGRGACGVRGDERRLLLGRYGAFDPFGAVDEALDAERPAEAVAEAIRRAEAEAAGTGPTARVVAALAVELAARRPALRVESRFDLSVTLTGGVEVDLARVARATAGEPEAVLRRAVERLVSLLPEGAGATLSEIPWESARGMLVPRLVGPAFLAQIAARDDDAPALWIEPVAGDVHVAYQVRYGDRARYVRAGELDGWGVSGAEARAAAADNLVALSGRSRFVREPYRDGAWVVVHTGDGLDAARLILPGVYERLRASLEEPIVAAVPHRDTMLACRAEGSSFDRFRARVDALASRAA